MTNESGHVRDEIEALLDGCLDRAERERVESHLAGCEACDRERTALARLRDALRADLRRAEAPDDLRGSLVAALDREDRESEGSRASSRGRRVRIFAAAGAAAALVVLAVFLARPRDLQAVVAGDYERFRAGKLPLEIETSEPAKLEKLFADRAVAFPTRVLDLSMMGYRLLGGRVLADGARKRAFFAYRDEEGKVLACQMYEGDVRDLSGAPELRRHGDFTFFVYRATSQTQVLWQEGTVVCVLVSDIPSEEVVQLAFAKAMKA